jgi:hypothetical protein
MRLLVQEEMSALELMMGECAGRVCMPRGYGSQIG